MKPLHLKIAGLNSFREVQEIEFSDLCATGVFGIFGSTGSGKSTILDAMTLALYGTVERAAGNTQGILNHAEKRLAVEFSFALNVAGKRCNYRAERSYLRSGERTVKASNCRLVEFRDGRETVLAAKADEMTGTVERILGLNVKEFTRAVVLPQGKFAEFLTMKPKERRQMLEHLLSLEAYGGDLSARVTEQLRKAEFELNGVEQRRQGLGDASAERVQEAEGDLQAALTQAADLSQEFAAKQEQYEEAREIWALQEQLHKLQKEEAGLAAAQEDIDRKTARLQEAERAEAIRPVLAEAKLAEARLKAAEEQAAGDFSRLQTAGQAGEAAAERWKLANQNRLELEPRCLRRIEQLEQAKILEGDIRGREERLNAVRKKYGVLEKSCQELEQKTRDGKERKTAIRKRQDEVKAQLGQITVDPGRRAQLNAAAQALAAYVLITGQAAALEADDKGNVKAREELSMKLQASSTVLHSLQLAETELQARLRNRRQSAPAGEEVPGEQARLLERRRHIIADVERCEREAREEEARLVQISGERQSIQEQVAAVEMEIREMQAIWQDAKCLTEQKNAALKDLEQKNLAGRLRADLVEGEPCPVCGSLHHPEPTGILTEELLAEAEEELEQAQQKLRTAEAEREEKTTVLAVAKAQLFAGQEREIAQQGHVAAKQRAVFDRRQELAASERDLATEALRISLGEQEAGLKQAGLALRQWQKELDELNSAWEEARRRLAEAEKQQQKTQTQLAAIQGAEETLRVRLEQLRAEAIRRKRELDGLRGDFAPEEIGLWQKKYAAWDRKAQVLSREAVDLEEQMEKADSLLQKLLLEKGDAELELQSLKTVGVEAARELTEVKAKLADLMAGQPAEEELQQVKRELSRARSAEAELKNAYDVARSEEVQAEQALAVSRKALELSKEGVKQVRSKQKQGLLTAGFDSAAEAQAALCGESERFELNREIVIWRREWETLQQKVTACGEALGGRSLKPEEWLAWTLQLKELEKARTAAIERRGAAQQRVEKIKAEHQEWLRLEEHRKALSRRLHLLKTLQNVFKGSAFIEFIAQEQLAGICLAASDRLKELTNQRYALEVDAEGGFVMRDDANGGVRRPVNTLSGGELFITALSLALALSAQIQLRGEAPLEFFFLDEGFGTLDAGLLETVMNTLEKLHMQNLTIGIISHVPELRSRLARRLIITPAEAGGVGSKVKMEMA